MNNREAKERIKSSLSYMESLDADEEEVKDIEALRMAIKALEQSEWIPATERLPEETGEYLVSTDNDEIFVIPYDEHERDFGYWYEEFSEETGGKIGEEWRSADDNCMKVVAWRPLPEPYREEEE